MLSALCFLAALRVVATTTSRLSLVERVRRSDSEENSYSASPAVSRMPREPPLPRRVPASRRTRRRKEKRRAPMSRDPRAPLRGLPPHSRSPWAIGGSAAVAAAIGTVVAAAARVLSKTRSPGRRGQCAPGSGGGAVAPLPRWLRTLVFALTMASLVPTSVAKYPQSGWFLTRGSESCREFCNAVQSNYTERPGKHLYDLGKYHCNNVRMTYVRTEDDFKFVMAAVNAAQKEPGEGFRETFPSGACSLGYKEQNKPDNGNVSDGHISEKLAPYWQKKNGTEQGYCFYKPQNSPSDGICDKKKSGDDYRRICCCYDDRYDDPTSLCPLPNPDGTVSDCNGSPYNPSVNDATWVAARHSCIRPSFPTCTAGKWKDETKQICTYCGAGKFGPIGGLTSEAEACKQGHGVNGTCPVGRFGYDLDYGPYGASECTACEEKWGKDTPKGSKFCTGTPLVGWIIGGKGQDCDYACTVQTGYRFDPTWDESQRARCNATQMIKVDSTVEFKTANAGIKEASHRYFGCTSYSEGGSTSWRAPMLSNIDYNNKYVCSHRRPNGGGYVNNATSACKYKSPGMTRMCCCVGPNETARGMCPLTAQDCRLGTTWGLAPGVNDLHLASYCGWCPPGKHGAINDQLLAICVDCSVGRFETREGSSECSPCSIGRFSGTTQRNKSCIECAAGLYTGNVSGSSVCKACGKGKITPSFPLPQSEEDCEACLPGTFAALLGQSACLNCSAGLYSSVSTSSACSACSKGRVTSSANLQSCETCLPGTFAALLGQSECSKCSTSRFSAATAATSASACVECTIGRFSAGTGRSVECSAIASSCPPLNDTNLASGVEVKSGSKVSLLKKPSTSSSIPSFFGFGDQISLQCKDGTRPTSGPSIVACTASGAWEPDPLLVEKPTQCTVQFCTDVVVLPPASSVDVLTSASETKQGKMLDLKNMGAPSVVALRCAETARMILNSTVHDFGFALETKCLATGEFPLQWLGANQTVLDFTQIICQCGQGFKQGTGETSAECIACLDGTYAPLNNKQERYECRACPRLGVDCNDGILVILKDYWYDVARAAMVDSEGNLGVRTSTKMYPCAMREACLLDKTVVPMTVRCHENHTGVMCARCYHRNVDCGRGSVKEKDMCVRPMYFERGDEYMYFAKIARHCFRCPAGSDAMYAYFVTLALVIATCFVLIFVVVNRLYGAFERLLGKRRSDASGIVRVFFNWIQMVSMLQAIKLQPPEDVTNAMETAEAANVSLEWFPVQCTLRLDYLARVRIYMLIPPFAVVVPLIYMYIMSKCTPILRKQSARRRTMNRAGKKKSACDNAIFCIVARLMGDGQTQKMMRAHASLKEKEASLAVLGEEEFLHREIDFLISDLIEVEAELAALRAGGEPGADATEGSASPRASPAPLQIGGGSSEEENFEAPPPSIMMGGSSESPPPHCVEMDQARDAFAFVDRRRSMRISPDASDSPVGPPFFFRVISEKAISVRVEPSYDAEKMDYVVRLGDVIVAEEVHVLDGGLCFVKLVGPWGEGWLFDTLADGTIVLEVVAAEAMVDPSASAIQVYERNEMRHCFVALCAMQRTEATESAPNTIARDSIDHVLPIAWKQRDYDEFFMKYDADGDGTVDAAEFVAMYPSLRKQWRFESVWQEFQHIDVSCDGTLSRDELRCLVPLGSSDDELTQWMEQFDIGGKGFLTLADFVAIDSAVQRDMLQLAIGTAIVLCTYFVHSRVTKALLSLWSTEKIEGTRYLKFDVGEEALTLEHELMLVASAFYLFIFSIGIPIVGLFAMFYLRHELDSRRFATVTGFLTDGYRVEVAWFWEFVILVRKVVILGISLFIEEAFLQSLCAVVVLVIALSVQLYVLPFKLGALNTLEFASLVSVLATQLGGILMWYKQLPGNGEYLLQYQLGATVLLFAMNGLLIAAFIAVTAWYWLKDKSKDIVQWLPPAKAVFEAIVEFEERLRWPNGTPLLLAEMHEIRRGWSFFEAECEGLLWGHGAGYKTRMNISKNALKLADKLTSAAAKLEELLSKDDDAEKTGARKKAGGAATKVGAPTPAQATTAGVLRRGSTVHHVSMNPLNDAEEALEGGGGEAAARAVLSL